MNTYNKHFTKQYTDVKTKKQYATQQQKASHVLEKGLNKMNEYEYMINKICNAYMYTDMQEGELVDAITAIIKTQKYESKKDENMDS